MARWSAIVRRRRRRGRGGLTHGGIRTRRKDDQQRMVVVSDVRVVMAVMIICWADKGDVEDEVEEEEGQAEQASGCTKESS